MEFPLIKSLTRYILIKCFISNCAQKLLVKACTMGKNWMLGLLYLSIDSLYCIDIYCEFRSHIKM